MREGLVELTRNDLYATDHSDDRITFFHSAKEKGTKAARIGRRLLKEEGASCVSEDATPLEKFMGSKLAIVLLRDLVDLPFLHITPHSRISIGRMSD